MVYRATDLATGRSIAIKRLRDTRPKARKLFEGEYSLLSQLHHPRIIEVYEFGVDEIGPFYTMELLDKGDLVDVSPLPWREACRYLRDVASSLVLLHARRILHRDVTPRNVRFGNDGRCKLIDFGGMTSFGVPRNLVGTPACIAPEAVHGMPLDQRADLYALGAVAYYLLTGRHAYHARQVQGLFDAWARPVPLPSRFDNQIPSSLDALVASLLNQDPLARPGSAAEVIDRLTAIAELDPEVGDDVGGSYLARVALVGRSRELEQVRLELSAARHGRGGVVIVQGLSGIGVTRFLDEATLEAQLRGAIVVRASADAEAGDFELVRRLTRTLMDKLPDVRSAPSATHPSLVSFLPEFEALPLSPPSDHPPSSSDVSDALTLQRALRMFLTEAGQGRSLCLVVDDLQWSDELSATVLATLMYTGEEHTILLVAGLRSDLKPRASRAVETLRKLGRSIELHGLSAEEVASLLRSIFGEIANVERLAGFIHELTAGNPGQCLLLLGHLLRTDVVRYEEGLWVLPAELNAAQIPDELARATKERLSVLSERAARLAGNLSVLRGAFALPLIRALEPETTDVNLFVALDELIDHRIMVRLGSGGFRFASEFLRDAIGQALSPARREHLHRQVGQLLATEAASNPRAALEAGWHLLQGAELRAGAEVLVTGARDLLAQGESSGESFDALHTALAVLERDGRKPDDLLPLRFAMLRAAKQRGAAAVLEHGPKVQNMLVDQALAARAGGESWHSRAGNWLRRAMSRPTGESPQVSVSQPPPDARAQADDKPTFDLLRCTAAISEAAFATCDPVRCKQALAPLDKLKSDRLSASARAIADALRARLQLLEGQEGAALDTCRRLWTELKSGALAQASQEARSMLRGELLIPFGTLAALVGDKTLLDEIEAVLETQYPHRGRHDARYLSMVYHSSRGELDVAHRQRQQLETERSRGTASWELELPGTLILLFAYFCTGNAIGLKQIAEVLRRSAVAWPSLGPYALLGHAGYLLLRGNTRGPLESSAQLLSDFKPGTRHGWPMVYALLARAHNELEQFEQARGLCIAALEHVGALDPGFSLLYLELDRQLAHAELGLGKHAAAARRIDQLLGEHTRSGGLALGLLHETGTRIALVAPQSANFSRHLKAMDRCYRSTRNPVLIARAVRLAEAGIAAAQAQYPPQITSQIAPKLANSTLQSILTRVAGSIDRERAALEVLLELSEAEGGLLYRVDEGTLTLVAHQTTYPPPLDLVTTLERFVAELDVETQSLRAPGDDEREPGMLNTMGQGDRSGTGGLEHTRSEESAYLPVALLVPGLDGLVAVAALEAKGRAPRPPRTELTELLARCLVGQTRDSEFHTGISAHISK